MRRISEVSGIAGNSLNLIARGQIAVTPNIVEKVIRAMTTLDQVRMTKLGVSGQFAKSFW